MLPSQPARPTPGRTHPSKRTYRIIGIGVVVIVLLSCIGVGGIGIYFFSTGKLAKPVLEQGASPIRPVGFTPVDTIEIVPDGNSHSDAKGVGLAISPDKAITQKVELTSSQVDQTFEEALGAGYKLESLAYSVLQNGGDDGSRRGKLTFPASSLESRLVVVVDGKYAGVLDVEPVDGKLEINPFLTASASDPGFTPQGIETGTTYYLVAQPKSGFRLPSPSSQNKRPPGSAAHVQQGMLDSCGDWWHNYCVRNKLGTVYIFYDSKLPTSATFNDLAETSAGIMQKYEKELGIKAAELSKNNPLYIVVGGSDAPKYSSKTGNLYLPVDLSESPGGQPNWQTLAHELFHWVEDEEYPMTANVLSGVESWWLEMAADNATFLINDEALTAHLSKYGRVNLGIKLGWQLNPFTWSSSEEARYIQSQMVQVGLCDDTSVCSVSRTQFVAAINAGTYPFDAGAQERYLKNMDDVARYLLGAAPSVTNSGIYLPENVRNGHWYGDYLLARRAKTGDTEFWFTSSAPQMTRDDTGVKIQAELVKGAVYPLWVGNGGESPGEDMVVNSGIPVGLQIEGVAGSPDFWFSINDGSPQRVSGAANLYIAPIHQKLGINKVRLVAMGAGDEIFRAQLAPIDLQGDWQAKDLKLITVAQDTCGYESNAENEADFGLGQLPEDVFIKAMSAYGTFKNDPADPKKIRLIWTQVTPISQPGVTFEGSIEPGQEEIKLKYTVTIAKQVTTLDPAEVFTAAPGHTNPTAGAARWGLLPLIPGTGLLGLLLRKRKLQKNLLFLLLAISLLLLPLLAGCGLGNAYGTVHGEYSFKKIEYSGVNYTKSYPDGNIWRLEGGSGQITSNLTVLAPVDPLDKDKGTTEKQCQEELVFATNGLVIEDGRITPETFLQ
ncbi:MAG: hypothetical protein PHQ40_10190 [Anaerolineaceae bacterium]|nr:hypothetical protein [Anaerolineaceae bacterium]